MTMKRQFDNEFTKLRYVSNIRIIFSVVVRLNIYLTINNRSKRPADKQFAVIISHLGILDKFIMCEHSMCKNIKFHYSIAYYLS